MEYAVIPCYDMEQEVNDEKEGEIIVKCVDDYSKIIFLGGGIMAERLYRQIQGIDKKLIGVMDLQEPDQRVKMEFNGFKIESPLYYEKDLTADDTAVIVAIGNVMVPFIVQKYLEQYGYGEKNLFVVNPYTSLRFFFIDDDLAAEKRIPSIDSGYELVSSLFHDSLSKRTYELLMKSKPYDKIEDPYEIVAYTQIKDMYYFEEDYWQSFDFAGEYEDAATVLDCGAYNGDSILPICEKIPQDEIYYYAFEPLKENADCIRNNSEFGKICNELKVIECGVGEADKMLSFKLPDNGDKEGGRFVDGNESGGDSVLEIKRLDNLNLDIKGTLYIKMDIEGAELEALKGAEQLIRRYKPYLAVCLYHRKNDLLYIPTYLYQVMPEYAFYLRGGYHTILWAIPKN